MSAKRPKISKRKLLNLGFWMIVAAFAFVLIPMVFNKEKAVVCEEIHIDIQPKSNLFFVENDEVIEILKEANEGRSLIGQAKTDFDLNRMELALNSNPFLSEANVYQDVSGSLFVDVKQKEPVVRIITKKQESYYLDRANNKIPFSKEYSPRLIVATGNISESFADSTEAFSQNLLEVSNLVQYIIHNELWNAQFSQIYVDKFGELRLIPKVGNHTIVVGSAQNLEEKFEKLFTFYKGGLSQVGWEKYKVIDLRYKGQVIAKKKE